MDDHSLFKFKQFSVAHDQCGMKVNTDGIVLGALTQAEQANRILDIGTGSGFIALMLAQNTSAQIVGVEIEENAFKQASQNFEISTWSNRLQAIHIDFKDFAQSYSNQFDIIVSNPPFFKPPVGKKMNAESGISKIRATARYFDSLPFRDLLEGVSKLLESQGLFYVILPYEEEELFLEEAARFNLYLQKKIEIYTTTNKPPTRCVMVFGKNIVKEVELSLLLIQNADGSYTEAFKELTSKFYDHLL